jgi:hypothetical protein
MSGTGVIFDDGVAAVQSRYWGLSSAFEIGYDSEGRPVLDVSSSPGGDHDIGDHQDVSFSGLASGEFIAYNGSIWVNREIAASDIPDLSGTYSLVGHNHDGVYAAIGHDHDSDYAAIGHTHDDRYYTETEADGLFALLGHDHDADYADIAHDHDDRYYTESEADSLFAAAGHNHDGLYSAVGHGHAASEITAGTFASGDFVFQGKLTIGGNFQLPVNAEVTVSATTGYLIVSGSSAPNTGGNMVLYGSTHATMANDIVFRSDTTELLRWDNSDDRWESTKAFSIGALAATTGFFTSYLRVIRDGPSTRTTLESKVTGDANPRWLVTLDGKMGWGDGTAAQDVNLYRSAANVLKTDDAFQCAGLSATTGTFSGQVLVADAVAGAPGIAFSSETDTGLKLAASGYVILSVGGSAAFSIWGTSWALFAGYVDTTEHYRVDGTKVLGNRITGWAAPTGTATRTTFNTATVTVSELAERVHALIDDFFTHGAIGT